MTRRDTAARRVTSLLAALALLMLGPALSFPVTAAPQTTTGSGNSDNYLPVMVVLDTSGSMTETSASGTSRIDAARSAVIDLVDSLSPNSQFGLLAYPGSAAKSVGGCPIGDVEVALGPLDPVETSAAVRRLSPDGQTPTGPALAHAAELVTQKWGPGARGTIVLVSDGESNCGDTDVCAVAERISADGIAVQINTVGLQISEEGARELRCVAEASGGRYVSTDDPDELRAVMQDLGGARLELTAEVPTRIPVVSGTGTGGTAVTLTVSSVGRARADDVRVNLDFRDSAGIPGSVLVPRPVRFLGNLEPGASRTVQIVVRPDDSRLETFDWTAAAGAANAAGRQRQGTTRTVEPFGTPTGLLAGVERAAVLGDSYSSGEGVRLYTQGTDDPEHGNVCHRSSQAYGPRVFGDDDTLMIACSGAVTADFYAQQKSGSQHMTPQLLALRAEAVGPESPQAVLLSVGGNDIGFGDLVLLCTVRSSCHLSDYERFESTAMSRIAAVGNDLRRVYRDVDRAVNDAEARDRRGGRVAPVVVVPYPRIVPTDQAGAAASSGCQLGLSAEEVRFFNRVLDALNLQIAAAVRSLRSEGLPVHYAADVVEAFQPDHTICDGGVSYAVHAGTRTNPEENLRVLGDLRALAHPNGDGHAAMARAVTAWAAMQAPTTARDIPRWEHTVVASLNPIADWWGRQQVSAAEVYEAGGSVEIDADGYAPSATVVFRVDSVPRVLGSAVADADGRVRARVHLPADIAAGGHHLRTFGIGADGLPRETATEVRVLPPHARIALTVFGIAVLTLVVTLFAFGSRRRRARAVATG